MDGTLIRDLRRRLGLTQAQLADLVQVDQGTVSRWERGLESPRPARRADLQRLLLRDESRRSMQRGLAIVRQNYLPAALLDSRLRLVELSAGGRAFYRERGRDPDSLIGLEFERYAERSGISGLYRQLVGSGLLTGDALLFRFVSASGGQAHATVYEPIFEGTRLVGVLNYVAARFALPAREGSSIELVEVVRTEDPSVAIALHRGDQADAVLSRLRSG